MKRTLVIAIFGVATVCLSTEARAQCPSGLTSPLQLITGQTWVFQTESAGSPVGQSSIGRFTATFVPPSTSLPFGRGTLAITETLNNGNYVTAGVTLPGTYQINPDCSGGNFSFNSGAEAVVFAFIFVNGSTEMYMTSTQSTNAGTSVQNWGTAKLASPPIGCPLGTTNPLDVLRNATFGFKLSPSNYFPGNPPAGVGVLTLSEGVSRNGSAVPIGLVTGNVTLMNFGSSPVIQSPITGNYTVDPDCSGGTISFGGAAGLPLTFQYVFVNPAELGFFFGAGFTEIYMLSLNGANPAVGHAKKF